MLDFNYLRKKYPEFIYHGYSISKDDCSLKVTYCFEIKGLEIFRPEWSFPACADFDLSDDLLKNLVFSLGMVELISYWKATCSPRVVVKPHGLNFDMIQWWKSLYFDGLGEFFFVNGIETEIDSFMNITSNEAVIAPFQGETILDGALVPVGGGKDSAVTLKVLERMKDKILPYVINGREATRMTCEVAGYKDVSVIAKRTIDKNLLKLNSEGYLNGHTPFSAIVAFSSLIAAILNGKKYVVLSNESSANESTVLGQKVNHQFSKSEDFENNFITYENKYINSGVSYFSLLRPLSEMQIAMLFAKYKEFHHVFKSCNVGSKKDIWCSNCPKCLFVYTILSPFLTQSELRDIFGENLFEKEELLDVFKELTGILPNKPFECVGSREEVVTAANSTIEKMKNASIKLPYILEYFDEADLKSEKALEDYVSFYDKKHHIPEFFERFLKEELKEQVGYVSQN